MTRPLASPGETEGERPSGGSEVAPAFDSLPDIARKLRIQADRLGARECYLFSLAERGTSLVLGSCLDFGYLPGSLPAAAVAQRFGEEAARAALTHSLVLCWEGYQGRSPILGDARWCRRLATALDEAGLALPLYSERNQHGVAIFLGEDIRTDDEMLIEVQARCHALFSTASSLRPGDDKPLRRISKRELECLKLTARGLTSEEIAHELGLSVHTANQYLLNTTQKLNAVNRVHAVAKALRSGLIA